MKILVLSDSHAALSFMRLCITSVQPDAVIHLGDYYDDATAMAEEYPHIRFIQLPGNCDRYRVPPDVPQIMAIDVGGARLYMTHGHHHHVKSDLEGLLFAARGYEAKAALFGHTHSPLCYREDDGLLVLNPGSCGYYGGSAGLMEIENGEIKHCRLIRQSDLEEMK